MGDYPTPDGYVGSGSDGDMMRTGTTGRLAYDPNSPFQPTSERRNETTNLFGHSDDGMTELGFPIDKSGSV